MIMIIPLTAGGGVDANVPYQLLVRCTMYKSWIYFGTLDKAYNHQN